MASSMSDMEFELSFLPQYWLTWLVIASQAQVPEEPAEKATIYQGQLFVTNTHQLRDREVILFGYA